jgi:hypothetical protein
MHQFIQFPMELIRHSMSIEVAATSAQLNKENQIRTNTLLMQLTTQFYANLWGAFDMVISPVTPEPMKRLAWAMIQGGSIMMRRILDNYDVQDKDRIVPDLVELINGQQQQLNNLGIQGSPAWGQLPGQAPAPGGTGGPGGYVPQQGMGAPGGGMSQLAA